MKSYRLHVLMFTVLTILITVSVYPNKSAVRIVVPNKVVKGSDVTITLEVTHSGNNFIHHVNWVYLKVNGVENKKWEFGSFSLPEKEDFSRTVTIKADDKLDLEADANCNIHGSMGVSKATVLLQ